MPTIKVENVFDIENAIAANEQLTIKMTIELELGHATSDMDSIEQLMVAGYEVNIMKVSGRYATEYRCRAYYTGKIDTKVVWDRARNFEVKK